MIAALFRIVILLLPLVAVVLWIRWRSRTDRTDEELQTELAKLRRTLIVLCAFMLAAVLGFWLTDHSGGDARTKYIPPHTVDGQVIPGRFVPVDDAADEEQGEDTEDEDQRDQTPG